MQVQAPIELVWSIVSDPERQLEFMHGVTRWEVDSDFPIDALGLRSAATVRLPTQMAVAPRPCAKRATTSHA